MTFFVSTVVCLCQVINPDVVIVETKSVPPSVNLHSLIGHLRYLFLYKILNYRKYLPYLLKFMRLHQNLLHEILNCQLKLPLNLLYKQEIHHFWYTSQSQHHLFHRKHFLICKKFLINLLQRTCSQVGFHILLSTL